MAHLVSKKPALTAPLRAHNLLGRGPQCNVRIVATGADMTGISRVHAQVDWIGGRRWQVRDVSRYGTRVNGVALNPQEPRRLRRGDRIRIGERGWELTLEDDSPPGPWAQGAAGAVLDAEAEVLTVPGSLGSELAVYRPEGPEDEVASPSGWVYAIGEDAPRPVADGDRLDVDGEEWVIHLPQVTGETVGGSSVDEEAPRLAELTLRIVDERAPTPRLFVLGLGSEPAELRWQAHSRLLVYLADAAATDRLETEQMLAERGPFGEGWRPVVELVAALGLKRPRFHQLCHYARRQLAELGVADPDALFDRRLPEHLRLGFGSVEIG